MHDTQLTVLGLLLHHGSVLLRVNAQTPCVNEANTLPIGIMARAEQLRIEKNNQKQNQKQNLIHAESAMEIRAPTVLNSLLVAHEQR